MWLLTTSCSILIGEGANKYQAALVYLTPVVPGHPFTAVGRSLAWAPQWGYLRQEWPETSRGGWP